MGTISQISSPLMHAFSEHRRALESLESINENNQSYQHPNNASVHSKIFTRSDTCEYMSIIAGNGSQKSSFDCKFEI
jgi:hypothetical protein